MLIALVILALVTKFEKKSKHHIIRVHFFLIKNLMMNFIIFSEVEIIETITKTEYIGQNGGAGLTR